MSHSTRTRVVRSGILGAFAALGVLAFSSSAFAQTRTCQIGGGISLKPPGSGDAGAATSEQVSGTYTESGPFLSVPGNPDSMSMLLTLSPSQPTNPTWLIAPFFQTMGVNEGPNTCGQTGDRGTITYASGICGQIVDSFQVMQTSPYTLSHTLSGVLDLSGIGSVAVSPITREVTTNLTVNGASGSVFFHDSTGRPFCNWTYTAVYNPCHPVVPLPITYNASATFISGDGTSANPFSGSIVRTSTPTPAPAVPPTGIAAMVALLAAVGVFFGRKVVLSGGPRST